MTEYHVVWSDRAYETLRKIADFIGKDSRQGAKNVVRELVQHSQSLSTLPRRNPVEPSLAEATVEYRFLLKWNYKIIYTILEQDAIVLIVLIFDTRQDMAKLEIQSR
jgi:plasmid stabilization system protein ParE